MRRSLQNKSGVEGIYWIKKRRRWIVHVHADDVSFHSDLGVHKTLKQAIAARRDFDARFGDPEKMSHTDFLAAVYTWRAEQQ